MTWYSFGLCASTFEAWCVARVSASVLCMVYYQVPDVWAWCGHVFAAVELVVWAVPSARL